MTLSLFGAQRDQLETRLFRITIGCRHSEQFLKLTARREPRNSWRTPEGREDRQHRTTQVFSGRTLGRRWTFPSRWRKLSKFGYLVSRRKKRVHRERRCDLKSTFDCTTYESTPWSDWCFIQPSLAHFSYVYVKSVWFSVVSSIILINSCQSTTQMSILIIESWSKDDFPLLYINSGVVPLYIFVHVDVLVCRLNWKNMCVDLVRLCCCFRKVKLKDAVSTNHCPGLWRGPGVGALVVPYFTVLALWQRSLVTNQNCK